MIALETTHLTRKFGKVTAVDDLNLQVPQGSLFGLIGPNGAGKTTTLRMLAGLLQPTSGEIRLNGEARNSNYDEQKRMIGYMPDFFGVYEDLLVWEYLDFFARCYRITAERRRQVVDELLELVDLTEKREAQVQTLSRGMRQRLCLAHALVHDPQILLLDEPASGLDPRARVEMRELLRELSAMGKTILLSSHILSELEELCDSIGIIERGKLVASGSLDSIRKQARQEHRLRVKTINSLEEVEAVLGNLPGVQNLERVNPVLGGEMVEFNLKGGDEAVADVLESLVNQKIRVVSFHEVRNDLEDIFMQLTQGETA